MIHLSPLPKLLGIAEPLIQAPMAGAQGAALAIAVAAAGGLGSIPCAMLTPETIRREAQMFRQATDKPLNLNFFCHERPKPDAAREAAWRAALSPYYAEFGIDPAKPMPSADRAPFDETLCALVEDIRPEVASFHFGLPEAGLLARLRATGAKILSSATSVAEARWLEQRGCDIVIAQGAEAGGHRGVFLTEDPLAAAANQPSLFALLPQIVDAVSIPVVAAGGIADRRGIAAAFMLGASGVQIGTAFLHCPEATISAPHRAALAKAGAADTALTNLFTGRPARGIVNRLMRERGPISTEAPDFPLAGGALAPLRSAAEARGSGDFSPLWSGQAAALGRPLPAGELTRQLMREARELF
jgi:nitronate monooxygenase